MKVRIRRPRRSRVADIARLRMQVEALKGQLRAKEAKLESERLAKVEHRRVREERSSLQARLHPRRAAVRGALRNGARARAAYRYLLGEKPRERR